MFKRLKSYRSRGLTSRFVLGSVIWSALVIVSGIATMISMPTATSPTNHATPKKTLQGSPIALTNVSPSPGAVLGSNIGAKPALKPVVTGRSKAPSYIGMFIASSPSDPASNSVLDAVAATGCNLVYNYTAFDGSVDQVNASLAYAQAKGLKVIISLDSLYDQLPDSQQNVRNFGQYGSTNEQIALSIVRNYQANPAVWGFSLTDEKPESTGDLATWGPILSDRYSKIKALTTKPVMAVLVGWSSDQSSDRTSLFSGVAKMSDVLADDYYPIPYTPVGNISTLVAESSAIHPTWFIEQVFSWSSYSDTASSLGFKASAARLPTSAEMVQMGRAALDSGATNLLLYSYFDIASQPGQLSQVKAAVTQLRN